MVISKHTHQTTVKQKQNKLLYYYLIYSLFLMLVYIPTFLTGINHMFQFTYFSNFVACVFSFFYFIWNKFKIEKCKGFFNSKLVHSCVLVNLLITMIIALLFIDSIITGTFITAIQEDFLEITLHLFSPVFFLLVFLNNKELKRFKNQESWEVIYVFIIPLFYITYLFIGFYCDLTTKLYYSFLTPPWVSTVFYSNDVVGYIMFVVCLLNIMLLFFYFAYLFNE